MEINPTELQKIQAFVQGVGVLVAAAALVANAIFSFLRMKHDNSSRSISASITLVRDWRDKETQEALRFIYNELEQKYPEPWVCGYSNIPDAKDRSMVFKVSHLCDEIASRTIRGEADAEFIITFLGPSIVRIAGILWPYLAAEREWRASRGAISNDPDYQGDFMLLADKAARTDISKLTQRRYSRFSRRRI